MNSAPPPASDAWMALRVTAKVRESAVITSFHLQPETASQWRDFAPGQFLIVRLDIPGRSEPALRHYSLSCAPGRSGSYRISVKREPLGMGSVHLHDEVGIGDVILAQGPRGAFVLDSASQRPALLLSGGVGLTPLVSMLYALADSGRRVFFVHACENPEMHALRGEVDMLAASRPGIHAHYIYRQPAPTDLLDHRCQSVGLLDRALLQSLLPLDDYEAYLCGPPGFMQASYALLRGLGLPRERIAYEFFGPATVLETQHAPVPASDAEPLAAPPTDSAAPVVRFAVSGMERAWQDDSATLLSFAEDCGLAPDFSCRAGVCGSCHTRLLAGKVRHVEEPLNPPPAGEVLLCCTQPDGPVILAL